MSRRPPIHPYLALGIGIVFISFSAILVKSSSAPSTVIAAWRLLLATGLMLPVWWWKHRSEIGSIKGRDWGLAFLSGVFLALHFALWFASLSYTSVASSVVLVTLQPVFAFAGAYLLFGERIRTAALTGAGIAVTGGMILGWGDIALGGTAFFGDLLALSGAAMVTAYWLAGQHLRKKLSLMTYTTIVYGTAGLLLAAACLAMGAPLLAHPLRDWTLFLLLALFPTLLGHSLLNWVIRWVPATTVSVSILGEPVGASILAWFLFKEQPGALQWTGGLLIMAGVYGFLRYKEAPTRENPARRSRALER
ncbi:drug/metabolite transporter (DMT)-like permease [Melghirimyces profundicolus]|uniref:Drug/metabolite transporter (DMT)-like permease n=1 Tax=Melghirimyces profundicolus TaxID=1242148 RepID=A0A2T6C4G0_9BACL|nr:DMT family transporter [Melghirimyces profundicolus]PTX63198.1 drug/metabolite transporter (DMT)-like permease [Melghirimyces profundicolus]